MRSCADLATAGDGGRVAVGGIVLVHQQPGSAKGVLFVTLEDEAGMANLIVWPALFEQQRRLVLAARLLACHGRVQREGAVLHVIAKRLEDLSDLLHGIEQRPGGAATGNAAGRSGKDTPRPHDIYIPDFRPGPGIRVPTRDFR